MKQIRRLVDSEFVKTCDEHVPRFSSLYWNFFPNVVQAKTDTSRVDPEHGNVSQVLYKLGHDRNQIFILDLETNGFSEAKFTLETNF